MSTSGAASASLPSDARSNERPSPNAADFTSRKLPETQTDEPISPLVYWPSRPKNPDDGHSRIEGRSYSASNAATASETVLRWLACVRLSLRRLVGEARLKADVVA